MPALIAILFLFEVAQTGTPAAIIERYVRALGGEAALGAVKTRVTEGEFDNGRGLNTRFRMIEESPNRRVTLIGTAAIDSAAGSGRGYDGVKGWDKSYIGTGLRALEGRELADLARDADMLRPLHLLDDCKTTTVDSDGTNDVIVCANSIGGTIRNVFDRRSGLLVSQAIENGPRQLVVRYDDYRQVDAVRLPFKTHLDINGATVKFDAATIRQDLAVDPLVFQMPKQ